MVGEFWTRIAIWLALILYAGSVVCYVDKKITVARWLWTFGCFLYLSHVVLAFEYFHHWSHQTAFTKTATDTEAVIGVKTGFGIYVNYLFTAVWSLDALYWWIAGNTRYASRSFQISFWIHAFFMFMILNGAIIFVSGNVRIIGVVLLSVILINFMIAGLEQRSETEN